MSKKNLSCVLYPEVNGKDSEFYKDMLKTCKLQRPLANYIYASYIASNMADVMDQHGYARNVQGQHSAKDVLKFIDFSSLQDEINSLNLTELQEGFVDSNGIRVDFTNAKDALEKADAFNDSHKASVALVIQHGDVYNIIAAEKNSRTLDRGDDVKQRLKVWDVYKQVFNSIGIDIESMPQELASTFSAYNIDLVKTLTNLKNVGISNMYKKDALILFNMDSNSPLVQRLVGKFGSLENAAQAIDDLNHGIDTTDKQGKQLLIRAVNQCQKFQGLDLDALKAQVEQMTQQVLVASPEESIRKELHALNKKYKIDVNEIHRTGSKIKALSEAAADAAILLQRQIRQLENQKGNNAEGKKMEKTLNQIMKELANKKYYAGILNFLNEATTQVAEVDNMLRNIPQTGTEIEKAMGTARILQDIKTIKDQYYDIVTALADDGLTIDESIGQSDIDNIRQMATVIRDYFNKKDKVVDNLTESTMFNIMTQVVGSYTPDGQSMINAVRMAAADTSIMDWLYSMGRSSNVLIAAMGTIIRNAQDSRDADMNAFSLRIRRATDKLYKSGSNSEFMYEDGGHIISDIDWTLYKNARKNEIKSLYKQGLRGFDLKQAIEDWEDVNTEDRVVDITNGRTERVPNGNYRKNFPDLTSAQQEYYDTIMQIKGEIGSLLPAYAQHHYLPPQLRREMLDALGNAKNVGDVAKAVRNKVENLWTIREDDTDYSMNGIIDGDEYQITEGSFDNTPLRQIPIFYVNPLKDQSELLKDFSSGVQALVGTALNYEAMNSVAQVVEFMGDFVKNQPTRDELKKADMVEIKTLRVFKDLKRHFSNANTSKLIDAFIAQHIYGQKLLPSQQKWWSKAVTNLISYTSFRGLATNYPGALSNYLMGEFQMLIEAGAGEFYGLSDYTWAHTKLFGGSGAGGEIMELLTNNVNHKGVLLRQMFDPLQENFESQGRTRYYKSLFRQMVSRDCSFIGYSSGEYLIHYVNMYAVLHRTKVKLNGKEICLYDAFEMSPKQDGNSELVLKQGVTTLAGDTISQEFLDNIRRRIRGVNQSTHGSMNNEDKGLIHQYLLGRLVMNFRQWMVEHLSRRFRKRHFDASLGMEREGYWVSLYKLVWGKDLDEAAKDRDVAKVLGLFFKDMIRFLFRAKAQWYNLDDMQRYNVKRVRSEMSLFIVLLGLEFALGEPEKHKRDFWRRWWIYQTKRLIVDFEASMPNLNMIDSMFTILQSPMAGVNTLNSFLYLIQGLFNGDLFEEIKSGDHKGEIKYWRNVKKYVLPFYKDFERLEKMGEDDEVFKVFDKTPGNH